MAALLILLSILGLVVGLLFLSEATTGVGILAIAAVLGIYARLAQAEQHHRTLIEVLDPEASGRKSPKSLTRRDLEKAVEEKRARVDS
jgi:hypothetical protein